jgi:hypothetical protein
METNHNADGDPTPGEYRVTITYKPGEGRRWFLSVRADWLVETHVYDAEHGWIVPPMTVGEGAVDYTQARYHWRLCQSTWKPSAEAAVAHRHRILAPIEVRDLLATAQRA